jgi:hypothetical protein
MMGGMEGAYYQFHNVQNHKTCQIRQHSSLLLYEIQKITITRLAWGYGRGANKQSLGRVVVVVVVVVVVCVCVSPLLQESGQ